MRSREGLRSRFQPRTRSHSRAACIKPASMPGTLRCASAACSAARMRWRISAAALRVKVIARICSGAAATHSNAR